jgi:HlyD family secretion protein
VQTPIEQANTSSPTSAIAVPRSSAQGFAREPRAKARRWLPLVKRSLAGIALLAAAGGLFYAWLPEPIPVDVVLAARGPLRVTVDEDGRTRVKDRYVISAPLLANLARIELEPGDSVQSGQLLARLMPLEPPLLDARTRAQSEARVASALASRRQSESAVTRARTALEYANSEAERQRSLNAQGATALHALENAELQQRTLREDLASAEFASSVAGYELEMARLTVARQSGRGRPDEEITLGAPLAGQVLKVIQKSAGVVQPGAALLELGDVHALEIVADLLTSDAVHIHPKARTWIQRWGGDAVLAAHVRSIEPSAFTRLSALGVEEQRVNVIIDLDAPRAEWAALGDGYRVEVQILTWQADDVLAVPESAIFRRQDSWATFAVREGRARLVPIEIGHRNGERVEVRRGLGVGAQVIVHPSDRVSDGERVAAREAPVAASGRPGATPSE